MGGDDGGDGGGGREVSNGVGDVEKDDAVDAETEEGDEQEEEEEVAGGEDDSGDDEEEGEDEDLDGIAGRFAFKEFAEEEDDDEMGEAEDEALGAIDDLEADFGPEKEGGDKNDEMEEESGSVAEDPAE
jgi:hypothetical protein